MKQIEILSCIIGCINILLFGNILGNNGIAYFAIAYVSFSVIRTFISGGMSDVLGKILRARNTKGQYKNVAFIQKRILILQGGIGLVAAILFAAFAGNIAEKLFRVQYSTFIIWILAPALCIRTISTVLIGWLQGEGNELPATVVAPLRQILLLGFGLLFVNILGDYGTKVSALLGDTAYTAMYGGVGLAIAVDLTELLILLFTGLVVWGRRHSRKQDDGEGMKQVDSLISTVRIFYGAMWMPMLIQLFKVLPLWLGMLFYRKSVADGKLFAENFGMLSGKFLVCCGIPVLFLCILLQVKNSKTINAYKKEDYRLSKNSYQNGMRIAVVCALFFTMFLAVMAEQLAGVICKADRKTIAEMFRYGSALLLFAVLFYYFSGLLTLLGKKYRLLGVFGLVDILFVIISSLLLNSGKIGVMSLIYAAMIAMGVGCLLLGFLCCKALHVNVDWLRTFAIPIAIVSAVGLLCMLLGNVFTPHLGNLVTVFVCLIIAAIVYWFLYKKSSVY